MTAINSQLRILITIDLDVLTSNTLIAIAVSFSMNVLRIIKFTHDEKFVILWEGSTK